MFLAVRAGNLQQSAPFDFTPVGVSLETRLNPQADPPWVAAVRDHWTAGRHDSNKMLRDLKLDDL